MQEVLKKIMKETINPLFKVEGFKKNSNNFFKAFPDFSWTVKIQSSRHNLQEGIEFIINTGIYTDKIFGTLNEWDPPKFPKEEESVLRTNISEIKGESSCWYKITPENDLEVFKEHLHNDIVNAVFPHLNQFQSIDDVIKELEIWDGSDNYENPHHLTIIYNSFGFTDKAQNRINEIYSALTVTSQKEFTKELGLRLGLNIEHLEKR